MSNDMMKTTLSIPDVLPILPLHDNVAFPLITSPVLITDPISIQVIDQARATHNFVALIARADDPARHNVREVGTVALVRESVDVTGDGDTGATDKKSERRVVRVVLAGAERVRIEEFVQTEPYLVARCRRLPDVEETGANVEVLLGATKSLFRMLVGLSLDLPDALGVTIELLPSPRHVAYFVASNLALATDVRQELLELDPVTKKLEKLVEILKHDVAIHRVVAKVTSDTATEVTKAQRDAILRKHLEAVRRELGETDGEREEVKELAERVGALPLPPDARMEVDRELQRLRRIPPESPEHGIVRTYLEWIGKLPWGKTTGGAIDEARARKALDEDHYDLDKVKDRIVEHLAVKALREERKNDLSAAAAQLRFDMRNEPILCLIGPPGVGKTSLGQSIARAMDRAFARASLGGVHDEAEIRGHRRTYIGAMPGRIIQAIARAQAQNPVFMLDEVDKLGTGLHGDPYAALLEVLDPAQNQAFVDTYLGVPFDLSQVLFICTANTTDTIPPPLLDRMEVLSLAGYTDREKAHIAERYIIPRQRVANGLREGEVELDAELVTRLIREYTREAGVRNLERQIAAVLRKVALRVRGGAPTPIKVAPADLREHLGAQRFFDEVAERIDRPGVATGLAWTPAGGDILFVEASAVQSERTQLLLTGMLGDVMRESGLAALSWLRANAERLGIDPQTLHNKEVHVHVPAGAIPKDGPSAGLTILCALASLTLRRPVRSDLAMTGEITLRGKVLPVGGIKEKVIAAHRAGLKKILVPKRNTAALDDIPDEVRKACDIVLVESVDDALELALDVTTHEPAVPDVTHTH